MVMIYLKNFQGTKKFAIRTCSDRPSDCQLDEHLSHWLSITKILTIKVHWLSDVRELKR